MKKEKIVEKFMKNGINITTEKKDIISSGTVFQFGNEDVIFYLDSLKFRLKFIADSEGARAIGQYSESKNELCMLLYNYDNSLGVGLTEPMGIGCLNDKNIYFVCRVYTLGKQKENHLIHYTFFIDH